MADETAADAEHHRAVPPHERLESPLVARLDEAAQQLPVRQVGPARRQRDPA
jgi:hypothetical protein